MAGRWEEFGKYGADGIPGWLALARQLDDLITGPVSPVTNARGLGARLNYLLNRKGGMDALRKAGVTVKDKTIEGWFEKKTTPRKADLARIDSAYWDLRRRNAAPSLKARLRNEGRSRTVEIHPVDQSHVQQGRSREIAHRQVSLFGDIWDDMVDAWVDADQEALDTIWDEVITDLGSDYDAYSYVAGVGFNAATD
jgi:hypothetical protein